MTKKAKAEIGYDLNTTYTGPMTTVEGELASNYMEIDAPEAEVTPEVVVEVTPEVTPEVVTVAVEEPVVKKRVMRG